MDLALNNLQRLICYKIQPTNQLYVWIMIAWSYYCLPRIINVYYLLQIIGIMSTLNKQTNDSY